MGSSQSYNFTGADNQNLLIKLLNDSIKQYDDELTIIVSELLNKKGIVDKGKAILLKEFCNGIHEVVKHLKSYEYINLIELGRLLEEYFLLYEEKSVDKITKKIAVINHWLNNHKIQ